MTSSDYVLFSPTELEDERLYSVKTWPDAVLEPSLTDWRREIELRLPPQDNPATLALARQMREQAASDGPLSTRCWPGSGTSPLSTPWIRRCCPGADPTDAFPFQTRAGFCEHYAAAFVVMMRAAGVPARWSPATRGASSTRSTAR